MNFDLKLRAFHCDSLFHEVRQSAPFLWAGIDEDQLLQSYFLRYGKSNYRTAYCIVIRVSMVRSNSINCLIDCTIDGMINRAKLLLWSLPHLLQLLRGVFLALTSYARVHFCPELMTSGASHKETGYMNPRFETSSNSGRVSTPSTLSSMNFLARFVSTKFGLQHVPCLHPRPFGFSRRCILFIIIGVWDKGSATHAL